MMYYVDDLLGRISIDVSRAFYSGNRFVVFRDLCHQHIRQLLGCYPLSTRTFCPKPPASGSLCEVV